LRAGNYVTLVVFTDVSIDVLTPRFLAV